MEREAVTSPKWGPANLLGIIASVDNIDARPDGVTEEEWRNSIGAITANPPSGPSFGDVFTNMVQQIESYISTVEISEDECAAPELLHTKYIYSLYRIHIELVAWINTMKPLIVQLLELGLNKAVTAEFEESKAALQHAAVIKQVKYVANEMCSVIGEFMVENDVQLIAIEDTMVLMGVAPDESEEDYDLEHQQEIVDALAKVIEHEKGR